jgi:hypothetical protein
MSFSSNDSENAHHLLLLKSYYCNHLLDNNVVSVSVMVSVESIGIGIEPKPI